MLMNLGLELPIIQAPMAGISTPTLAAAVSNAGGLGSLGIGSSTVAQARAAIEQTQAMTDRSININVFCHRPAVRDVVAEQEWLSFLAPLFAEFGTEPPTTLTETYPSFLVDDDAFRMLIEKRPAVVSFHFGLPLPDQLSALRDLGIRTMATATNLDEARTIEAAGIDAIVAQGIEAGGHRGMFDPAAPDERMSTAVLVRLLAAATRLPIIAAGGIMDGQGIRSALELGAVAAQLGTAFVACPESAAPTCYRENLLGPRAHMTRLTPTLSGRPARGMVNRFMEYCERDGSPRPAAYPLAYDAAKHLFAAARLHGNSEYAAQWAGQGAPLARAMPAAELIRVFTHEMRAAG